MKGSCTLAASVLAAASSVILFSSASGGHDAGLKHSTNQGTYVNLGMEKQKNSPRFDGLRFIETLVTAHK